MHTAARRWGKGFLIVDGRGYRFDAPAELTWRSDGMVADVRLRAAAATSGAAGRATPGRRPTSCTTVLAGRSRWAASRSARRGATCTSPAATACARAVHAHLWTGGADSWVWAVPMDGIRARSRAAGHRRRTLGLLGGVPRRVHRQQRPWPPLPARHRSPPLAAHVRRPAGAGAAARRPVPAGLDPAPGIRRWPASTPSRPAWCEVRQVAAEIGDGARRPAGRPGVACDAELPVRAERAGTALRRFEPGRRPAVPHRLPVPPAAARAGRASSGVPAGPATPERARRQQPVRVRALRQRRAADRSGRRLARLVRRPGTGGQRVAAAADAPVSAGATQRRLADAVDGYRRVRHRPRRCGRTAPCSTTRPPRRPDAVRLYNFPWFARFLLDAGDLDLAWRVMTRFYALGGQHFLAFELGGVVADLAAGS